MKLNRLLGSAALVAVATCGGLDTFSITETSTSVVPSNPLDPLGVLSFAGFDNMSIADNEELQNQGVEKSQIDSVHLNEVTLRIVDPPGEDFEFIDSIAFFVESDGLERKRIASGGPFPAGQSVVTLALDDVDLGPYASAESMTISSEADGRSPQQEVTIEATIGLDVDVNVDGVLCGD